MDGKRKSLKQRIILAFLLTAGIPMLLITAVLYTNSVLIVKQNNDELALLNLQKTESNIDAWMSSYEELLFQICTSDEVVALAGRLDQFPEDEVAKGSLRAKLQELFHSRSFIKSITFISSHGDMVFYDQYTTLSSKNSWIDRIGYTEAELFSMISSGRLHFFPTQYVVDFGGVPQYLFHLGRQLVDYQAIDQKNGVILLSIDAALLQSLCANHTETGHGFEFVIDHEGKILSFPDNTQIGRRISFTGHGQQERESDILKYINTWHGQPPYASAYLLHNQRLGWYIAGATDQSAAVTQLQEQQKNFLILWLAAVVLTIVISLMVSRNLLGRMSSVNTAFQQLGKGNLSTRVALDGSIPVEMVPIVTQFNQTLHLLESAVERENEAQQKRRFAEITALEAQINPHFLYNTLDTINWMAIQHDEREISDAISSLGDIFRYGIINVDQSVPVEDELRWLSKYVRLQQIRLKDSFECDLFVSPNAKRILIHKLVLQPFVENAIIHGLSKKESGGLLRVAVDASQDELLIVISDNGRGMPGSVVESINTGDFVSLEANHHLGMKNAISRLHIYYGTKASVRVQSKHGTTVHIILPREEV